MASVVINNPVVCAGGEHLTLDVSINGGAVQKFQFTSQELRSAISADQRHDALLAILRLHCGGLTRAQALAELQAGIQVTTS